MPASGEVSLVVRDRLEGRAAAWDSLVSQQPVASPFLRSFWLRHVLEPGAARFLLVVEGDRLLGGLPLVRDRLLGVARYRIAGQGVLCPDHLDLVAAPGRERDVQRLVRSWFDRPGSRVLDLSGLAEGSRLARALPGRAHVVALAPYQPLPGRDEDYLATRSGSFRRATRRAERRLADAGFAHARVAAPDVPAALVELGRLHRHRPGRGPLLAELSTLTDAFTDGVARGEARVDVLASPEETVAVSLAFTADRRLSLYQVARSTAREHGSAATVLLHRVIADAVDDGLVELDLLRGDEDYKASFADSSRTLLRLRVGRGPRGRALVAGWRVALRATSSPTSPRWARWRARR